MSSTPTQRSSTRRHHSPPRYEEEQANIHLHAKELLDLRHALAISLLPDINETDDEQDDDLNDSSDEKEKDTKEPIVDTWKTECKDTPASPFLFKSGKVHEANNPPLHFNFSSCSYLMN